MRKEEAVKTLLRLRTTIESRNEALRVAAPTQDRELADEVNKLVADLESQVQLEEQALALAESDIVSLKEELQKLDGLERQAERLATLSAVEAAHADASPAEATLDRVRTAIADLEAEARLNEELGANDRLLRQIEEASVQAAAKARLAELKAAHAGRANGAGTGDVTDDATVADPDAPPRGKRTL